MNRIDSNTHPSVLFVNVYLAATDKPLTANLDALILFLRNVGYHLFMSQQGKTFEESFYELKPSRYRELSR